MAATRPYGRCFRQQQVRASACIDRFKIGGVANYRLASLFEKNPFQAAGIVHGLIYPFHIQIAQLSCGAKTNQGDPHLCVWE